MTGIIIGGVSFVLLVLVIVQMFRTNASIKKEDARLLPIIRKIVSDMIMSDQVAILAENTEAEIGTD